MNAAESAHILRRMTATWPRQGKLDDAAYEEWLGFLSGYDVAVAMRAFGELRDTCTWRPSMADFRSAYFKALALTDEERKQLPAGDGDSDSLRDRYGSDQGGWVYCWRCDMALTLDERDYHSGYDESRGMYHHSCPRRGSAPQIPAVAKAAREKWYLDHKITVGHNVDPVPYIDVPRRTMKRAHQSQQIRDIARRAVESMTGAPQTPHQKTSETQGASL